MRISAKLNIFLGVRNLSIELLPPHLKYLGSYFRRRAMNLLFPFVVSVATGVAVAIVNDALDAAPGSARAIGAWLVSTMLTLGILEHWLLVLPLEATALWRWALNDTKGRPAPCKNTTKTAPALSTIESDEKLFHAR
jgi:putative photosynthetic complex assembly protein 2